MSGSLPSADPYLPGHGDPSWHARAYELDLRYDVDGNRLSGQAVVEVEALRDLERVVLDLAHLSVSKVRVDGKAPRRYAARSHRLVVDLREPLRSGGTARLSVTYSGRPRPLVERHHGDAGWEELTDGVIVAGQPHGAPTWFPCNDRPDDKAAYTITVTTHPDYTVVANGELVDRTRRGATVRWTHRQDEPMAAYLATVQIGRYVTVEQSDGEGTETGEEDGGVPIRTVLPESGVDDDAFAASFGRQPEMMAAFVERFGRYPFPAYAAVVTADELEIPLEAQSLSTFGVNFCSDDWDSVRLVAHELAHQWFGNAVTLRHWRDIWLHEGFACYAEWLWSEDSGGDSADEWARHHHARLADLDQDLVLADPGPELMFDDRVYKRGAMALHALRLTVGEEAFGDLLPAWVAEHAGGSVTTEDFRRFAGERTGADPGVLADLFDAWLDRPALPDLPPARVE